MIHFHYELFHIALKTMQKRAIYSNGNSQIPFFSVPFLFSQTQAHVHMQINQPFSFNTFNQSKINKRCNCIFSVSLRNRQGKKQQAFGYMMKKNKYEFWVKKKRKQQQLKHVEKKGM